MSNDDLWLRELAQVNREQQADEEGRLDERWDRLSRGELSPEEDAELRALAETSEEARAAYEAFRPLGPAFHSSVVQAVREQSLAQEAAPAESPAKKLLRFRKRTFSRLGGWSALTAAAAAVVVLLVPPAAPLPDYSLEISGGARTWRGNEPAAEVPVLAPGGRVEVLLRPAARTTGMDLDAQCYLSRGLDLRQLELRTTIDPGTGAVKLEGSIDGEAQPGAWTLWAVVGRQGKLPSPAQLQRLLTGPQVRDSKWVALPQEVRILARGLPP